MQTYTFYEAGTHFSQRLIRAHKDEAIIIVRAGEPRAMVLPISTKKNQNAFPKN